MTTTGRFVNNGRPVCNLEPGKGYGFKDPPGCIPVITINLSEKTFLQKADDILSKGDIPVLQEAQRGLQSGIDGMVEYFDYHPVAMALGAVGTALNEVFVPTNIIDFTPGKLLRIGRRGVQAVGDLARRTRKVEDAAAHAPRPQAPKPQPEAQRPKDDNVQVRGKNKGPCDHLRGGNPQGNGAYRGGAHESTSNPRGDGLDSHHMPPRSVSPLDPKDGPAIQMDPKDHQRTRSHGRSSAAIDYRESIRALLLDKKWRETILTEIGDVRRIARKIGQPTKYHEAIKEMLAYFRCLEANGLLP